METQVVYSKEFDKHTSPGHPENAQRLSVMMHDLTQSPFINDLELINPDILPEEHLYEIHSHEMIQQIKEYSQTGELWIDLDTYICKSDYETARLAAGGLLLLCYNVISGKTSNGFALIRPPGHHATANRSMGFCLFNNAAIAAHQLTKQNKKIFIFDLDVHHGNGTQNIFYHRNDVLYQSFHLYPHYPGTGAVDEIGTGNGTGYTVNAPLSYGNGDKAVNQIMDEIFLPIATQFKPDLIIVSSGFDSHNADMLGGLKLTANFFGEIVTKLQMIQPKLVCTLEGGYNLHWIGKCMLSQIGAMLNHQIIFEETVTEHPDADQIVNQLKEKLGTIWKL